MKRLGFGVVCLSLGLATVPALAERTNLLFEFESWLVEGVSGDDHSYSCRAKISVSGDSFSIRSLPNQVIRLEFHSDEWEFGEGDTAVLQVVMDDLSPWTFTDATLLQSSVFVDLYDPAQGKTFVGQVAKGKILSLRDISGNEVRTYTLAGSADAISHLGDCDKSPIPDRNPFN